VGRTVAQYFMRFHYLPILHLFYPKKVIEIVHLFGEISSIPI
jgi:hypothetical protein